MAKILIIDDEVGICEEFCDILQEEGYEVETAFNGPDGIKKFESTHFDLVFVDVLMPRMDGTEVFSRIKKIRNVPIIVMSGFLPHGKGRQIIALGAEAVLRKPLDLKQVLKIVKELTAKKSG